MLSKLWLGFASACSESRELWFVAIAICALIASILEAKQLGLIQAWELIAYDHLERWHRDLPPDDRLLIVTITESDLRQQQKWPLPDDVYAQLLEKLQASKPKVIGLDIYRDFPVEPGYQRLVQQLQKPNVIAIRNIDILTGTSAPPAISPKQVGFNDFPLDPGGIIRRYALFAELEDGFLPSFAFQLATVYLKGIGITATANQENGYLQLGNALFVPLQFHSGGYQTIDDSGYQILLDYRNRKQVAREVSLEEVLKGDINPSWVENKIVLIGSTAKSLKDQFFTPYTVNNQQMSGVAIHGQIVSHLLDIATGERSLRWFWSENEENIWITAWIILGTSLGLRFRHPVFLAIATLIGLILLLGSGLIIFFLSGWIPLAAPTFGFLLSVGMTVAYQSYNDHQQQQTVMKLLGQSTSPQIAEALWKGRNNLLNSGKLPGTLLTATVMFLDIKGFSTISEQMNPQDLLNWLNQILEEITHKVSQRHGIINKFTGDGIMAAFGVPIANNDLEDIAHDAQNCVYCALAISEHLELLNHQWQQQGLATIQMRIGIFTGPVIVGSLGGKERLEYGVIGDTVNTASRLESCEKERQPTNCRILIAQETLTLLNNQFKVESWGLMALKGKQQLVEVYRVLGTNDTH